MNTLRCLAVAMICLFSFVAGGCSNPEEYAQTSVKQKILKVGFEGMTVPCNWTQDTDIHGAVRIQGSKQFLCGFEIDYMKRLCELAGYKLEVYKFDWDGMLMAVATGKVDCAISMIVPTPERKLSIDFTIPYYYGEKVGLVQKNGVYASARSVADLRGARVTSMLNTLWYTEQINRLPNVEKLPALENVPTLVVALQSGKADMVLLDRPTAEAIVIANPDLGLLPFSGEGSFNLSKEETACAIALPKGNTELCKALESAMSKISKADVDKMVQEACLNQPLMKLP